MLNPDKILFIEKINHRFKRMTKSRQASGLSNCVDMIVKSLPDAVKAEVDNVEQAILAISRYKPRKVVFESIWVTEEGIQSIQSKHPNCQVCVHIHSNIPFLTAEANAFQWMMIYKKLGVTVIWNSLYSYNAMKNTVSSLYLPNIYKQKYHEANKIEDEFLDVACHGSLRPMKNQVMQAIAAIDYAKDVGKKLRFHMNLCRSEGGDDIKSSLKGLFSLHPGHQIVESPWLEHDKYVESLAKMDIGLQVSMSETFNIVAADYVAAGIPMVVSSEVNWAPQACYAKPSSSADIVAQMDYAIRQKPIEICRMMLESYSEDAADSWMAFIEA